MNCVIPGPNLKILGKAIHTLSKIGDEIYLEANEDYLSLRTVNIRNTVFGIIKFLPPFFSHYKISDPDTEQTSNSQRGVSCKMPMKGLLSVFKNPHQMEKQMELCKITLNNNSTKIVFNFRYKHDVCKTQNIWLSNGNELLEVAIFNDGVANKISGSSLLYSQILGNFQFTDNEINIDVTSQKIVIRNYVEGEHLLHCVRSQISMSPSEFCTYKICNNTNITFSLKPLRAAIQFAENFNLGITLTFERAGKPVEVMISNNITFEAHFIIASMNVDGQTQSTMNTETMPTKEKNTDNENMAPENHKTVVENVNWNDKDFDSDDISGVPIIIPNIPESPVMKRMKYIFNRCFETTFDPTTLHKNGIEIYAENSDPECENL